MGDMRGAAERYASELAVALGDRLRSVVLHGSVVRGEAVEGVSDVNLLVLVEAVETAMLRDLAPHARRWLREERALPLVLSWDEWAAASDVFAIESADMLDHRAVLHGHDPLAGVRVDDRHLRIQAERELRGKLIHLREGALAAAHQPGELGRLLLASLPSVATYLRAALRLAGEPVRDAATPDILSRGEALLGLDPSRLLELWELRGRGKKPPKVEVEDPRLVAVLEVLERTAHHVDTLSRESS